MAMQMTISKAAADYMGLIERGFGQTEGQPKPQVSRFPRYSMGESCGMIPLIGVSLVCGASRSEVAYYKSWLAVELALLRRKRVGVVLGRDTEVEFIGRRVALDTGLPRLLMESGKIKCEAAVEITRSLSNISMADVRFYKESVSLGEIEAGTIDVFAGDIDILFIDLLPAEIAAANGGANVSRALAGLADFSTRMNIAVFVGLSGAEQPELPLHGVDCGLVWLLSSDPITDRFDHNFEIRRLLMLAGRNGS